MIKKVDGKLMFEEKAYNVVKKLATIVIPAFSTFYFALQQAWGLPDATSVIGSAAAFCTLLGVLLHLSSANFNASSASNDGTVSLAPTETGSTLKLNMDPGVLASKDSVTLKVVPPGGLPSDQPVGGVGS